MQPLHHTIQLSTLQGSNLYKGGCNSLPNHSDKGTFLVAEGGIEPQIQGYEPRQQTTACYNRNLWGELDSNQQL